MVWRKFMYLFCHKPNYVCAVSLNLGGNSIAKRVLVSQSLLPHNYGDKSMGEIWGMNKTLFGIYFILGIIWAWALIAVFHAVTDSQRSIVQSIDLPEIVDTVSTIPVDVYELEREN